jgi:hypothetical protein
MNTVHRVCEAWRGFAMRRPRIAVVCRWIGRSILGILAAIVAWLAIVALVAAGFAVFRVLADDPRVLGLLGLIASIVPTGSFFWAWLTVVVLLFLIGRELARVRSQVALLNDSIGAYFHARKQAIEWRQRKALIRRLSETYGVSEDRLRGSDSALFDLLQDPYISEENKHFPVILDKLPATQGGEGQEPQTNAYPSTEK